MCGLRWKEKRPITQFSIKLSLLSEGTGGKGSKIRSICYAVCNFLHLHQIACEANDADSDGGTVSSIITRLQESIASVERKTDGDGSIRFIRILVSVFHRLSAFHTPFVGGRLPCFGEKSGKNSRCSYSLLPSHVLPNGSQRVS